MGQPGINARDEAIQIFFSLLRLGRMHDVPMLRVACVVSEHASLSALWNVAYARDFAAAVLCDVRKAGVLEEHWFLATGRAFLKTMDALDGRREGDDAEARMKELRAAHGRIPAPVDGELRRVVRLRNHARSLVVWADGSSETMDEDEVLAVVTGATKTLLRLHFVCEGVSHDVSASKNDGAGRDTEWSIHPRDVRYASAGVL